VVAFSIGGGLHMKILRLRRTFVLLGPSPIEGLVLLRPSSTRHYRKKMALILSAGALVNLLCAAIGLYVVSGNGLGPNGLASELAKAWIVLNLIAVLNLYPSTFRGSFGPLRSDGRQLLDLLKTTDEEIETVVSTSRLAEAHIAFVAGNFTLAHAALVQDLQSVETSGRGRVLMTAVLLNMGKREEGIDACRRYLAASGNQLLERALLMNNLAWALVDPAGGDVTAARLAEADALSSLALDYLPMMNGVRGTRGTVLVTKGEYRDAVPLLEDKRFRLEARGMRATVKASLALALAGSGHAARAQKALRKATALDPTNVHVHKARERITHS
jgi:tetratricopeptide (TPR) repeat protein